MVDQTLSVAMPSVSVVDQPQASYTPGNWYQTQQQQQQQQQPNESKDSSLPKAPASSFVFPTSSDTLSQKDEATLSTGFVTFPDSSQDKHDEPTNSRPIEEHVIVINQADGTIKEISNPNGNTQNNLGDNNFNVEANINNPNLPQLSENLTPPAQNRPPSGRPSPTGGNQRPPYYFHYQHGNNGPNTVNPRPPQRIPLPPRQKPVEHPPVGFKRRPPPHDQKLPNILPQFRPNAKTSHGHRGADKIGKFFFFLDIMILSICAYGRQNKLTNLFSRNDFFF